MSFSDFQINQACGYVCGGEMGFFIEFCFH